MWTEFYVDCGLTVCMYVMEGRGADSNPRGRVLQRACCQPRQHPNQPVSMAACPQNVIQEQWLQRQNQTRSGQLLYTATVSVCLPVWFSHKSRDPTSPNFVCVCCLWPLLGPCLVALQRSLEDDIKFPIIDPVVAWCHGSIAATCVRMG